MTLLGHSRATAKMSRGIYSRQILVLGGVQLIESMAFALPLSFFPNYVVGLGASVASIGLFTSSFMLSMAIMSPQFGGFSDKYGRKRIMMLGIIGDVVLGVLTGVVPSWQWLLLVRFINGAVSSAAMLSAEALLIDSTPPNMRGEASGFVMSTGMIGRNMGPITGGTIQWASMGLGLSELDSYRIPYFVDSGLALLALILVFALVSEPEKTAQPRAPAHDIGERKAKVPLPFSLKVMLVTAFVDGIGVGFLIPIMVLFYNDKFGIEPVGIGALLSISGFVGLLASYIAGRASDRMGRKPLIAIGNYVSQAFGVVLPLTGSVTQAGIAMSVRSLGFNVSMPAFRALRADIVPPEVRGKFFGYFGTAFTAGDVVSPILGTWIYSELRYSHFSVLGQSVPGYGIPFFVNAVLGFLSTTALLVLVKETVGGKAAHRAPAL
jgi:MFS family permease